MSVLLRLSFVSALALVSADAEACPLAAACNAGGAANICQLAGAVWTCDLTRNGNGTGAAAYAVYDGAGGVCAAAGNLCSWGTTATGANYCCEVARGAITNVNLLGGNQPDNLYNYYAAGPRTLDGNLTGLIDGREGNDNIYGSTSVAAGYLDDLRGASQSDYIYGDAGADVINGGTENDVLDGGSGGDTINGGPGDDLIDGQLGGDTCYGDAGNDGISGGSGVDTLHGNLGSDDICGGPGVDNLYGDEGDDELYDIDGEALDAGTEASIGDDCGDSALTTDATGECESYTLTAEPPNCP